MNAGVSAAPFHAAPAAQPRRPLRVLVLARSYPNTLFPGLGLWVQRLVRECAKTCMATVISPVPYCPPMLKLAEYARFRDIPPQRSEDGTQIFHPRFVVAPGRSAYTTEAVMYYLGVRASVDRLFRQDGFDLIHAHFTYPDGVVAARLGARYGVPVIATEHAPWRPNWMDASKIVCRQAVWAAQRLRFHIAVSRSVRTTISEFTGTTERIRVIPIGVDGRLFCPSATGKRVRSKQILYVGFINYNKGIDVLLRAASRVLPRVPEARLVLVGGSFYRNTRQQEDALRQLALTMDLQDRVTFVGHQPPEEVVRYMRDSALLVLPSHAESFGAVLVEALACGTPVLATRCGGPEDIVNERVGRMIEPGDTAALAEAIEHMLAHRDTYDPRQLRAYALEHFAWERVAERTMALYAETQNPTDMNRFAAVARH
jgi:teichuronic acid biosynthesis glycosyltransferase TuaC